MEKLLADIQAALFQSLYGVMSNEIIGDPSGLAKGMFQSLYGVMSNCRPGESPSAGRTRFNPSTG